MTYEQIVHRRMSVGGQACTGKRAMQSHL